MFDDYDEHEASRRESIVADSAFQPFSNHASSSEASDGEGDGGVAGKREIC